MIGLAKEKGSFKSIRSVSGEMSGWRESRKGYCCIKASHVYPGGSRKDHGEGRGDDADDVDLVGEA